MGTTPNTRQVKIKGLSNARIVADGLVNHRQQFTFQVISDFPDDEYGFIVSDDTPDSAFPVNAVVLP